MTHEIPSGELGEQIASMSRYTVDLGPPGKLPKVTLLQMPNGTGKTTSLLMIRAALTGEADKGTPKQFAAFVAPAIPTMRAHLFYGLPSTISPLTIEMTLDFLEGAVK